MNRYKFLAKQHKSIHLLFEDPAETQEAVWEYLNSLPAKECREVMKQMADVMTPPKNKKPKYNSGIDSEINIDVEEKDINKYQRDVISGNFVKKEFKKGKRIK